MLFGKTPFREYTDISVKDVNEWQRKYEKKMTIITVALMVVLVLVVVIKSSIYEGKIDAAKTTAQQMKEKDIKIAVVNRAGGGNWSFEYFSGVKQEAESMGITVHTFSSNHNHEDFRNTLLEVKDKNYDGIIIGASNIETFEEIKQIANKGIPIVTINSASELSRIKGVTTTIDDNGQVAITHLNNQLNGQGNIIYLSLVKDYPSSVIRNKNYEHFLRKNPKIKQVAWYGKATSHTALETKKAVITMLQKYKKGKIDVIFATWEAFARGATQAVKEAGRNEIKVYGIGFTNPDLHTIREKGSPWVSTTGVDLRELGAVNVRLLLKKIAGEETPAEYEFKPSLITQDELRSVKGAVNTESLKKVIRGWGENNDFKEDWMEELKESHTCKSINTAN